MSHKSRETGPAGKIPTSSGEGEALLKKEQGSSALLRLPKIIQLLGGFKHEFYVP